MTRIIFKAATYDNPDEEIDVEIDTSNNTMSFWADGQYFEFSIKLRARY